MTVSGEEVPVLRGRFCPAAFPVHRFSDRRAAADTAALQCVYNYLYYITISCIEQRVKTQESEFLFVFYVFVNFPVEGFTFDCLLAKIEENKTEGCP